MKHLLLLSNSTNFGERYLDHAMEEIRSHFSGVTKILFVPFALADHDAYTRKVRERFELERIEVQALAAGPAGVRALETAGGVFVGGGNTFRLLDRLQRSGLLEPLRDRALAGMPYLGSSAGSVIAAPTMMTTNDMPIVQPRSFTALGLVPFQINAHYLDPDPASHHMGETREDRLREFLEENAATVVGLREGAWIRVEGHEARLCGRAGARIFRRNMDPVEVAPRERFDNLIV